MYHLARSRPNGVRYLDRFALTTRDFRDCRVSADVPRSSWGLRVTIEHYLRRRDAYLHECGIETPDIIYEIFTGEFPPKLASDLTSAGYRLTFVQDRDVPSGSSTLPGRTVARVYIATVETPDIADR